MKKVLIVLALVALAVLPVAAKKGIEAVGVEVGEPTGITILFPIENKKLDGYATAAFRFGSTNSVDVLAGGQYEVTTFKIEKAKFGVNAGLEAGLSVILGEGGGVGVSGRGTVSVDYDWTWKNVGDFTAYLRAGLGYGVRFSSDVSGAISFCAALGLVYHL